MANNASPEKQVHLKVYLHHYLWVKFDAIGNIDAATFLSRKAKPAPFKPEWPRTMAGLLLLASFYGVLIFLSFSKAGKVQSDK